MNATEPVPVLDRIVLWSLQTPLSKSTRYLAATMLVVLTAVTRALLITSALPWLLFIPVILGMALIFGKGVGFYTSVLSTIAAAITIGDPAQPLFLTSGQAWGSALFLVVTTLMARVVGELRATFARSISLNAELGERQSFLSGVLGSSTDSIQVMDLEGRVSFMSEGGMRAMELDQFDRIRDRPWRDFWQETGGDDAADALHAARRGRSSHFSGKAVTFAGNAKWWNVSVSPILGADGAPDRILAVSRDMTALYESQEQQSLLNGELGHRLKNVLSLVQSIANQTFRQAESVTDANAVFAERLAALGKATDVLTSSSWQSADMRDVVSAGLTSFAGSPDRIEVAGPPLRLDSQVALALTLALHELTTNAVKYGALSNETGRISLAWNSIPQSPDEDARFTLEWRESGGPPVSPPTRRGFGSKLIDRSLRSYFRGETVLDFRPEGVRFTIDAPLPSFDVETG